MRVLLIGGSKVNKLVAVASDRFKNTIDIDGIQFISEIDGYFDKGGVFDRVIVASPGYDYDGITQSELRSNIDEFIKSVRERLKRFTMVIVTETEDNGAQLVEATLDITGNSAIVFLDKSRGEKFSSTFLNNLIITDLSNFSSKFNVLDIGFLQELDQQTSDGIINAEEVDWSTEREVEQAEYTVPKAQEIDMEGLGDEQEEYSDETPVGVQDDFGISGSFDEFAEADWAGSNEFDGESENDTEPGNDFGNIDFGLDDSEEFSDSNYESDSSSSESADEASDEFRDTDESEEFGEFDGIGEFDELGGANEVDASDSFEGSSDFDFNPSDEVEAQNDFNFEDNFDEFEQGDTSNNSDEQGENGFDISSAFDNEIDNNIENDSFETSGNGNNLEDIDKLFNDDFDEGGSSQIEETQEENRDDLQTQDEAPKKGKLKLKGNRGAEKSESAKKNSKLKPKNTVSTSDVEAMYSENSQERGLSGKDLSSASNINGIKGAGIKKRTNKKQPMNQQMSSYDMLKIKLDGYKKRGNLLLVTGAPNSGKTTIAANIANLVCKLGYQVLIVDMDTKGRGMSYINLDSYEAVHSQRSDASTLKLALNNSGDRFGRYVNIVRPGMHLLSTGLAYDSQDAKDAIGKASLTKFIHQAQNIYQLVIIDIGFEDATEYFTEFTLAADEIVIVSEVNTHGMMQLLLELSNISDSNENISDIIFENSKLILNKEDGLNRLFGKKTFNTGQLLGALDEKLTELIGFSLDKRISDLEVCGLLKYNKSFEEYWYNKAYLSDTQDGEAIFLEILQNILDIK